MSASEQAARVVHGFEDGMRVGMTMLARASELYTVAPAHVLQEFAAAFLPDFRRIAPLGPGIRVVSLGPMADEVVEAMTEAGATVRALDEAREFSIVATQREGIIYPFDTRQGGVMVETCLHYDDPITAAYFRLAFDRTWERALPPGSVRGAARPGGGTTRG